jgi:hypothetical protein
MSYSNNVKAGDISNEDWLVLVEDEGRDGMGRVLGFCVCPTEAEAESIAQNRGELFDALELFIDEDPADDVWCEVIEYHDFKKSYGNRMPLYGNSFRLVA